MYALFGPEMALMPAQDSPSVCSHVFMSLQEDGVEERNWIEHNFAGFVHVIGTPAGVLACRCDAAVARFCHC